MENTQQIALIKSNNIEAIKQKIFKVLERLGISHSRFTKFLMRTFNYSVPAQYLSHHHLNVRQEELIMNNLLDKAIKEVMYDNSTIEVAVFDGEEVPVELNSKQIINNLTNVRPTGQFLSADYARRLALLESFKDDGGNKADMYVGAEQRMFYDFTALKDTEQKEVVSILTKKMSVSLKPLYS